MTVTVFQPDQLSHLTSLLEDSSTARVYTRASGGLARLAGATATAAAATRYPSDSSTDHPDKSETSIPAVLRPTSAAAIAANTGVHGGDGGGCGDKLNERNAAAIASVEESWLRFASMLRAVSAALRGGERLAQHEVLNSGLLDGPCSQALRTVVEDFEEGVVAAAAMATAAGAAALLLSRVIGDASVRIHVAR